ncbi:DEKNAAC101332 [Brettanomyces naardenensis]|uniref:DEKNAAC101333 n=1 Tax=Brettanomyces naardenensis TaxID=13370 RepID=A0A448YHP9_BRENA|nr:DEKNAAC101332 [Brettanomyces naardenensis]
MSSLLEKSLDDIIGSSSTKGSRVGKARGRGGRRGFGRRRRAPVPLHLDEQSERLAKGEPYLRVSNLHPELTEKDLEQLFSSIGPIKFVKLELNTNGQSTGIAFVGYEHSRDCSHAIEKFDGRRAAGQIISVENAVPLAERIFASAPRSDRKKRERRRKDKGEKREPQHRKTAEELDAELNSYMANEGQQEQAAVQEPAVVQESVQLQESSAPVEQETAGPSAASQEPFAAVDNGEMNVD